MSRLLLLACVLFMGVAQLATAQETTVADYMMVHVDDRREPFRYAPDHFEVRPGAIIELMVFENSTHSIVSVDGAWSDAVATSTGEFGTAQFRAPLTPGTYRFYDKFTATPTTASGQGLVGSFTVPAGVPPVPGAQAESSALGAVGLVGLVALVALSLRPRR